MNIITLEKYLLQLNALIKATSIDRKTATILKAKVLTALKENKLYDFDSVRLESLSLYPSPNSPNDPYRGTLKEISKHLEAKISIVSRNEQPVFTIPRGFSLTAADRTNYDNINQLTAKDAEISSLNSQLNVKNELLINLRNENDNLKSEIADLFSKLKSKRIFDIIKMIGGPAVYLSIIGGAFLFGLYFGKNKDDETRFSLREHNKVLKDSIELLTKKLKDKKL